MHTLRYFCVLIICVLTGFGIPEAHAQKVMLIEDMTTVRPIKIYEGSYISIKSTLEPEWHTILLERLIPEEGIIIHKGGMLTIGDITHIRRERTWVKVIGTSLQSFGMAWGLYSGILLVFNRADIQVGSALIGSLVPMSVGWLMKKIWLHKIYKVGKKTRLKLIDISLPADPYNELPPIINYIP